MIYKYKWLDNFMRRWFIKRYFKKYLKLHPEKYKIENGCYVINLTEIIGHETKHSDSKIKNAMDHVITKGGFDNNEQQTK